MSSKYYKWAKELYPQVERIIEDCKEYSPDSIQILMDSVEKGDKLIYVLKEENEDGLGLCVLSFDEDHVEVPSPYTVGGYNYFLLGVIGNNKVDKVEKYIFLDSDELAEAISRTDEGDEEFNRYSVCDYSIPFSIAREVKGGKKR